MLFLKSKSISKLSKSDKQKLVTDKGDRQIRQNMTDIAWDNRLIVAIAPTPNYSRQKHTQRAEPNNRPAMGIAVERDTVMSGKK